MYFNHPVDVNEAIAIVSDDYHPFGSNCRVSKPVQSIMHHYGVKKATVDILEEEEFFLMRDLKMADPDGDPRAQALFESAIVARIQGHLEQMKVRCAFRRALSPDPFSPVISTVDLHQCNAMGANSRAYRAGLPGLPEKALASDTR